MARTEVLKTYKLYINGGFPRSESGRSIKALGADGGLMAHICHASRKDLRDAVGAARAAHCKWLARTAYNRGQILYRLGEMLEGRAEEFAQAIKQSTGDDLRTARKEVQASVDRFVAYAGWADKFPQVLGCQNPVAGPYYNFTVPEGTGVCAVVAPDEASLLGLVSLIAPVICAGCTVVALGSEAHPIPTSILGEVCQVSDVPAGVINLLMGKRGELIDWIAGHGEIDAVHAAGMSEKEAKGLRMGAAVNVKRVRIRDTSGDGWYDDEVCESPWWVEGFVEMKTIWHPSGA